MIGLKWNWRKTAQKRGLREKEGTQWEREDKERKRAREKERKEREMREKRERKGDAKAK